MKAIRSFLSVFLVALLVCTMPVLAFAAGEQGGNTTLTANVPATISMNVGAGGCTEVDGASYSGNTKITAPLGAVVAYQILPAEDYKIASVTYNGADVTAEVSGGTYTAPALTNHAAFAVTFSAIPTETPGTDIPQTGDTSHVMLWTVLILFSLVSLLVLLFHRKRGTT